MGIELEGSRIASMLQIKPDNSWWSGAGNFFLYVEHVFTIMFTLELILRLMANGCTYLRSFFNAMDAVVVCLSILDLYILSLIDFSFPNVSFLRLVRLLKLAKVLRFVRVMRMFRQLRILLHAIKMSLSALFWSIALLTVIEVVAAIFMAQSLQPWLQDGTQDMDDQQAVYNYFGTFGRAFISFFELTIAPGAWSAMGRLIIYRVNGAYAIFFFLYVAGITFAIVTVIRAIFLKETLASANSDSDIVVAELAHEKGKMVKRLRNVFNTLDQDGSGDISMQELKGMLKNPDLVHLFHTLELNTDQAEGFFELIDDGDGRLSFEEFLTGILRFKGGDKMDLITMLYENKKIIDRVWLMDQTLRQVKDDVAHLRCKT
eukprot:gnl/MRDRNA2_/MRDRNA2_74716_c0_seq1.p1 gnl/MRDRNA2_/MRDRNA2_74716_c0~~gnl/MRDRNA2_/MRDRNA2_74716_c0_seq1.p1  ORF type:complete len:374 (+),score=51.21 gnl/MRDRNA2_/MRDRNA2_74716_c0_seq1:2-1123(+)